MRASGIGTNTEILYFLRAASRSCKNPIAEYYMGEWEWNTIATGGDKQAAALLQWPGALGLQTCKDQDNLPFMALQP